MGSLHILHTVPPIAKQDMLQINVGNGVGDDHGNIY